MQQQWMHKMQISKLLAIAIAILRRKCLFQYSYFPIYVTYFMVFVKQGKLMWVLLKYSFDFILCTKGLDLVNQCSLKVLNG